MRFSVSILGVVGVALTFASLLLPWLDVEFFDQTAERLLTDYDTYIGYTSDLERFAYSTALYMMVTGLAVSVYSLLGGFITLAGACTFALGGTFGGSDSMAFGTWELAGATVSPGIGLYVGFLAAVATIAAIMFPLDVGLGKGGARPKFRTWHLSCK